jgi:hypothetical protein
MHGGLIRLQELLAFSTTIANWYELLTVFFFFFF